jgi:heme-degrading monooxygenase HmoA
VHVRVWEYDVPPERAGAFVAAYGPDGDWAALFRAAEGFVGTRLYRATDDVRRYLTVDTWREEASWRAFLEASGPTYQALDDRLADLAGGGRLVTEGPG